MPEYRHVYYPGHLGPRPQTEFPGQDAGILWDAPIKRVRQPYADALIQGAASSSPSPTTRDRDQESSYTIQLPRRFRDLFFQDLFERHERFELRLRWLGSQIGAGNAWRESVAYEFPSVAISTAARPVGAPTAVIETLALAAEGSPDGDPPITVSVITARDWTPHA